MAEGLVPREKYKDAKAFIRQIRDQKDPPPVIITPMPAEGAKAQQCPQNAAKYAIEHGGSPVMGFKLWTLPFEKVKRFPGATPKQVGYIAQVHCVVKQAGGKYVDPTPADENDEGKEMIFVPSSLVYPGTSARDIARMINSGLEPRMGAVCSGICLLFRQQTSSPVLNVARPQDLQLLLCPSLAVVPEITPERLAAMGICVVCGDRFCIPASMLLPLIGWEPAA